MKSKPLTVWEELELALGGGGKFRVLLHLILNPEEAFTKYALVKATGLRTPSVENQLQTLLKLGWIKEYSFRPKTYQVNLENELTAHISEAFQKAKYIKVET